MERRAAGKSGDGGTSNICPAAAASSRNAGMASALVERMALMTAVGMPPTLCNCAEEAESTACAEPKCEKRAARRWGPNCSRSANAR